MRCVSCGYTNRPGQRFCGQCGSRLGQVCAACGAQAGPGESFCGDCGAAIDAAAPARATATAASGRRDAEHRQLTVMFCDLVGSTALAQHVEAEEYREIVRRYYDDCAEAIRRWEGHVAQYVGDGVLAYFGYPHAHEDDAERAVRAGLDMLRTLERDFAKINATLDAERGVRLAARIGVHTGPVVVGDMAGGAGREALAVGETLNLAARLQAIAADDSLVMSGATLRLVRGIFVIEDLGCQPLKGISEPVAAYRVVQPSGVRSRLDVAGGRLTPFIGRDLELATLVDRWERVQEREGRAVLLIGEAGVGKSRLAYEFREHLSDVPHTWLESRCSPYATASAFHPVIALLEKGLAFQAVDRVDEKHAKLERALTLMGLPLAEGVPLLSAFLGLPASEAFPPLGMNAELQRRKTLELLAAWNLALGELQPMVVLVEDLHWCDPSSLEFLGRLVEQCATSRVLTLLTARPEFTASWPVRSHLTTVQLARLTKRQAREMVGAVSEEALPADVREVLVGRADGIPLYVEELTRAVVEPGAARSVEAIPATLQDSLVARLDRLSAAKEVAQRAAVLGREFSYALLAATAEIEDAALRHGLERLVDAEIFFARGVPPAATYVFKHALVQEAAYGSLLKRTREALHGRVVRVLVTQFPERAEAEPEAVARHAEAAGLADDAVVYYERAGAKAQGRSAHDEATVHLQRAIALIGTLAEGTQRDAREVRLQLALGGSLAAVRGYAHTATAQPYERARILCEAIGDVNQLALALIGLSISYHDRGETNRATALAERVLAIGEETRDETLLLAGHVQAGLQQYFRGKFAASLAHMERAIGLYDPARHRDVAFLYGTDQGVMARAYAALNSWCLGQPGQALARAREAVVLARSIMHPFSLAFALTFEALQHWQRGEHGQQCEYAAEVIALSEAQRFPLFLGVGRVLQAAGRAAAGAGAETVTEFMEGAALVVSTGNQAGAPEYFALLAETRAYANQQTDAIGAVEAGLFVAEQTGQHYFDAELHRLQGALLRATAAGSHAEVERFFRCALEIARAQEAHLFELRAATSLARLLADRGSRTEARAVLAPAYGWFSEGFDTRDLAEAKALLDALQ